MSNFEHAKYDANGVRIDDPSFNTQALREDTSLVNGVTFPAADTVAINTASVERLRIGNAGQTTLLANSASAALTVTQTGAGNAFVVEDSASTDSTPFVVDAVGTVVAGAPTALATSQWFGTTYISPKVQIQGASTGASFGLFSYSTSASNTGQLNLGKGASNTVGTNTLVANGDYLGVINWQGADGTNLINAARIEGHIDGTPGTNDMPGRLVFSTTADGASSPTERMRIDRAGNVGIGGAAQAFSRLELAGTFPSSSAITIAAHASGVIPSGTTNVARMFSTTPSTQAAAFTCSNLQHYYAEQGTIGAGSAVTNQYGFLATNTLTGATNNYGFYSTIAAATGRWNFYAAGTADNYFAGKVGIGTPPGVGTHLNVQSTLTGNPNAYSIYSGPTNDGTVTASVNAYLAVPATASTVTNVRGYWASQGTFTGAVTNNFGFAAHSTLTGGANNYGFYGDIAAGTNRWNFYAAGTAANYFAGDIQLGKTVTAGGTTGAQTINKTVGTVNFAAAATSLVVTNSLVTANSIITATVGTNDTTMKSVAVVAAAGSFTLHANAAATAETRVNFHVFN